MAAKKRKRAEKTEEHDDNKETDEPAGEKKETASAQSQLQMIQFEKKLKEMKKRGNTSIYSTTTKFSQNVKSQEEKLITSLKEQKSKIISDSDEFSRAFASMFHKTFSPKFCGQVSAATVDSSELIQNSLLRSHQLSLMEDSDSLAASVRSVRNTLTSLITNDLVIGNGWEEEADETIRDLRQLQQEALVKVQNALTDEEEHDVEDKNAKEGWVKTVKKSEKHVRKFLKHLPIPVSDDSD